MNFECIKDGQLHHQLISRIDVTDHLFNTYTKLLKEWDFDGAIALKRLIIVSLASIYEALLLHFAKKFDFAKIEEIKEYFTVIDYGSSLGDFSINNTSLKCTRIPRPHGHLSLFSVQKDYWYAKVSFANLIAAYKNLPPAHIVAFPPSTIKFFERIRKIRNWIHIFSILEDEMPVQKIADFDLNRCLDGFKELDTHFLIASSRLSYSGHVSTILASANDSLT